MPAWLWTALALLVDGAAGLAGGLLPESWLARRRPPLVGFAAGALIAAAFLDILPEALEAAGRHALDWTLGSFVLMAVFEWLVVEHHHRRGSEDERVAGHPVALLGADALHNIGDGAAIAVAFLMSTRLGLITALAVIVHEVPEEVGDFVLLRGWGVSRARALCALACVQLTAGAGAAATFAAWSAFGGVNGVILAIAAGTFVYIGAADLLPYVIGQHGRRRSSMLGFLAGIALLMAVTYA